MGGGGGGREEESIVVDRFVSWLFVLTGSLWLGTHAIDRSTARLTAWHRCLFVCPHGTRSAEVKKDPYTCLYTSSVRPKSCALGWICGYMKWSSEARTSGTGVAIDCDDG